MSARAAAQRALVAVLAWMPDSSARRRLDEVVRGYRERSGARFLTMTLVHGLIARTGASVLMVLAQRLHKGAFGIRFSAARNRA